MGGVSKGSKLKFCFGTPRVATSRETDLELDAACRGFGARQFQLLFDRERKGVC